MVQRLQNLKVLQAPELALRQPTKHSRLQVYSLGVKMCEGTGGFHLCAGGTGKVC